MWSSRPRGSPFDYARPRGSFYERSRPARSRYERHSHEYDRDYYDSQRHSRSRQYYEPEDMDREPEDAEYYEPEDDYANTEASTQTSGHRSWARNVRGDDDENGYWREDLQDMLGIDSQAHVQTLLRALETGKPLDDEAHGRVQLVLRTSEFRRWMSDKRSRIIVVDIPCHDDMTKRKKTELTHYAAGLHIWNERFNNSVSFSFFCGYFEHPSEETIVGLLRSLCAQLLCNNNLSETFACRFSAKEADRLQDGYVEELFLLLISLVEGILKRGAQLLCLIDGLHILEEENEQHFLELLKVFKQLVHDNNRSADGSVLKIVLTYPQAWNQEAFPYCNTKSLSGDMVPRRELKRNANGLTDGYHLDEILGRSTSR